jgi:tRNA(Arg) A34 adenosine deaminase TadA
MVQTPSLFSVRLPAWLEGFAQQCAEAEADYSSPEQRMALAIELARRNVLANSGGPFGAALFELDSHRLVAVGVNVVEQAGWSCGHAEVLALSLAEQRLGTFDLGAAHLPGYELASSSEPCLMCLGAIHWSGVRRLLCGSRDEDVRAIGFDEGSKPADWVAQLEKRGIEIVRDVLREASCQVLQLYRRQGGTVYNPGRPQGER